MTKQNSNMAAINFAEMNGHDSAIRRLNYHESLWYGRYVVGPFVSLLVLVATVYVSIPLCQNQGNEGVLVNQQYMFILPFSAVAVGFLLLYLIGDQDGDGDMDKTDAFHVIDENKDDMLDTKEFVSASLNLSGIIGSFVLVQILLLAVYAKYFSVQNTKIASKRKEVDADKAHYEEKLQNIAVETERLKEIAHREAANIRRDAEQRVIHLQQAATEHEARMLAIGALSCAFCHERVATSINVPCQHQILCDICASDFRIKNKKDVCPVEECGQPSILKKVKTTFVNCSSCSYQWESMYEFKVSSNCFHLLCVPCMSFHVRNSVGHQLNSIRDGGIKCPWKRKIYAKVLDVTSTLNGNGTTVLLILDDEDQNKDQNRNVSNISVGQHMFLQKGNSIGPNSIATVRSIEGVNITLDRIVAREDVVGNGKMVVFEQCCSARFKNDDFLRLKRQSEVVAILSKNLPNTTKGGETKGGETKEGETKQGETKHGETAGTERIPLPDIQTNTIDHVVALLKQKKNDHEIRGELKKYLNIKLPKQMKILRQAKDKLQKVQPKVIKKEYGHDGTDRFTSEFKPFSEKETINIGVRFLLSNIEGGHGVFCLNNENCPLPLDPLVGLNPRPASLIEAVDKSFSCSNCSEEMCRVCRIEGLPAKWHKGETCAEAKASRKKSADADGLQIEAYSKPCPNCNISGQHFHGHKCHHISPDGGCPQCKTHYCYGCAAYTVKGSKMLGPRSAAGNGNCRKNPQHATYCSKDRLYDNIDTSNGWPLDARCGCAICPFCKPGSRCDTCPGDCVVCRGLHPPGEPVEGSELEKLVKLADELQRIKVLNGGDGDGRTPIKRSLNTQLAPNVQQIVEMGFSSSRARRALQRHGDDVHAAILWLLRQ